ncbi:DEAD/DEAH box helicase [Dyella sp. A6]|uniref:DEAD/DEAH box helicase n=1 Tax=Dyella aluminiiresistens TaxID=3069105 RepID=UPI002E777BA6|nr:DEAD/DEAH box helicase [Dyella sp. A6]
MSAPSSDHAPAAAGFTALALSPEVLRALADVGYESPSPIQAATIPPLLEGRDVLGQAQTGTGKTAAFALPILTRIDLKPGKPQALVLAPTRELAIQVAEAFQRYAAHLPGLQVLPIYGGQSYGPQLHALRRGVHIVVGTPGRVIDHLDKGTLDLSELKYLVLDEADEMLRMGFIDDVEKVLEATPPGRQVALFSATMPAPIRKIAQRHLKDPTEITIKAATTTNTNIRQRYWFVSGLHKLDAMTRILEAEPFDAMIVFSRTKQATEELAEKLSARGFAAAAINGDIAQPQRERVIQQLKDGKLDILVATDVAARGLDVERISHVLNYDIPYDTESYVHRIGRTGRAGRSGEAILFVTPREKGMLRAIERATRQKIDEMKLPTVEAVNDQRIARFKQRISDVLAIGGLEQFQQLVEQYEQEHDVPAVEIAAALARIAQGDRPLLMEPPPVRERAPRENDSERAPRRRDADGSHERAPRREHAPRPHATEPGKITYRIEVGHEHGVKPGNIIGAIANEAGLDSQFIGKLSIRGDHSLVDLPEGMPKEIFEHLKKVWVARQQLQIHAWDGNDDGGSAAPTRRPGGFRKPGGNRPGNRKPHPHGHGGGKPGRGK